MTPKEKLEWWQVAAYVLGAGLVITTIIMIFLGHGGVVIGTWFWPAVLAIILTFRNVFLAGKRAGTKGDS